MKHFRLPFPLWVVFILVWQLSGTPSLAQWSTNPNVNNAISAATGNQFFPTIVSDGVGGAIITWHDLRSSFNRDIYAQRIDSAGVVRWSANGVAICTAAGEQENPVLVSDGAGGAIITWRDERSGSILTADIYAQRINASGNVQWTANGVAISTAANDQASPTIVSDGAGGAIITWTDRRNGTYDIYAQRVGTSGAVQWAANGVAISNAAGNEENPTIVSDGSGGAIITWSDSRGGNVDIYARRINAAGEVQWTTNGVAICTSASFQYFPTIASDGAVGAIITWQDLRNGNDYNVYAQRIDAAGAVQWTANGVAINTDANNQLYPNIVNDGAGGAIITWQDLRSGNDNDIYAQRIDTSGATKWTENGVAICTAAGGQSTPNIATDGAGGAIITWFDVDIYAQRTNASGIVLWATDGVAISNAANEQYSSTIISDGKGGAIITWHDFRNGADGDIYAQQVRTNGQLGMATAVQSDIAALPESFRLEQNYPNPFNPATTISFSLPFKSFVSLKVFDALGREVLILLADEFPAGTYSQQWNAVSLSSGFYFYRMQAGNFVETKKLILLR